MGDEILRAELADGDLAGAGERVAGAGDEGELVAVDDDGLDLGVVGFEGEDADFAGVRKDVVGMRLASARWTATLMCGFWRRYSSRRGRR